MGFLLRSNEVDGSRVKCVLYSPIRLIGVEEMASFLASALCVCVRAHVWFAQFVSKCGHTTLTLGNIGHCLELFLVNIVFEKLTAFVENVCGV